MAESYNGLKLKPLFHSEISSSFMLYDIFSDRPDIVKDFIQIFLGINCEKLLCVEREKSYRGKGTIDLFMTAETSNNKVEILLEVKVHDYLSATSGQIETYYKAALEKSPSKFGVYFIYLTQFNRSSLLQSEAVVPGTVDEFDSALSDLTEYKHNLKHLTWEDFYQFIASYEETLSREQALMLDLQRRWMLEKCHKDIADYTFEAGQRDINEFFNTEVDIPSELAFGYKVNKNKRVSFVVELAQCDENQLRKVLSIIKLLAASPSIDKRLKREAEDYTKKAVREFLNGLAESEQDWLLLSFYAGLFSFVDSSEHLQLNGTGSRGFSIRTYITGKGLISMCTLWANRTVEFSLKR